MNLKFFISRYLYAFLPFLILSVILILLLRVPVELNGRKEYGLVAVIVMLIYWPILSIGFALMTWIMIILGSFVRRMLFQLVGKSSE